MRPTKLLQEIRKMRFEEAYVGWTAGRLTQAEAALILGKYDGGGNARNELHHHQPR